MSDLLIVGIAMIIWVVLIAYSLYNGWRKGRLKYEAKKIINGLRPLISLILNIYIVIFGIMPLPYIEEFASKMNTSSPLASLLVNQGLPIVWVLILLVAILWISIKSLKPWLKYNSQELQWKSEENTKSKFRRYLESSKTLKRLVR